MEEEAILSIHREKFIDIINENFNERAEVFIVIDRCAGGDLVYLIVSFALDLQHNTEREGYHINLRNTCKYASPYCFVSHRIPLTWLLISTGRSEGGRKGGTPGE